MTDVKKTMIALLCAVALTGLAAEGRLVDVELPPAEGWSPIGFAFAPARYLEFPGPGSDVNGISLALTAAHNRQINGFAFAPFACWTDGDLNGIACSSIGNWYEGASFGIHFSSVVNIAEGTVNGLQLSMVNSAYRMSGWQMGLVNVVSEGGGIQMGLWNMAERWSGFQLGFVNMAMNYSGVQMGLGNIIGDSPLTACILFNVWF